jgi:S1-C subfamily serine protease
MIDRPDEPPRPATQVGSLRPGRLGAQSRAVALFASGILAAFLGLAAYGLLVPAPRPLTQAEVDDTVAQALASATPGPPQAQLAYVGVQRALVLVQAQGDDPQGAATFGSGVVIDAAGDILTSLHVVAKATSLKVTFADGSTVDATVAVSRPDTDIAVLQAGQLPPGVEPATLGNPGAMRVGSDAFVVGNPFGLYGSMSSGVVSGLDRSFKLDTGQVLSGLIQVDAAVNPGNSGGPLLNRNGQVVGIVAALLNPTKEDVFVGIGLAVPIDVAGGAAGLPPY